MVAPVHGTEAKPAAVSVGATPPNREGLPTAGGGILDGTKAPVAPDAVSPEIARQAERGRVVEEATGRMMAAMTIGMVVLLLVAGAR